MGQSDQHRHLYKRPDHHRFAPPRGAHPGPSAANGLADKPSVFVPRPLSLLELAAALRRSNPKEAANVYQQVKKEFPESAISEEADRGLDTIAPKS